MNKISKRWKRTKNIRCFLGLHKLERIHDDSGESTYMKECVRCGKIKIDNNVVLRFEVEDGK